MKNKSTGKRRSARLKRGKRKGAQGQAQRAVESGSTSEHPNGRPPGILELQPRVGNSAVWRLLEDQGQAVMKTRDPSLSQASRQPGLPIQRKPLRGINGKTVAEGEAAGDQGAAVPATVKVVREVVPAHEQAGKFSGYPNEMTALVFAHRHALDHQRMTAIIPDTAGSLHVVETDWKLAGKLARRTVKMPGARLIDPSGPRVPHAGWHERAKKAINNRKQDYSELKQLIAETIGVDPANIHIVSAPNSDPTKAPPGAKPGMINFAPWLKSSARSWPFVLEAGQDGPFPQPTTVIGPDAFLKRSPEFLRGTVVHEFRHGYHIQESIKLIKKWRKSKTKKNFHIWLYGRRKKIPAEIYAVASGSVKQTPGSNSSVSATELYAHVEGLMSSFHHIPEKTLKDPRAGMLLELTTRLLKISSFYLSVGNNQAKKEVLEKLGRYYCAISPAHQKIFAEAVDRLPEGFSTRGKRPESVKTAEKAWVADLKKICAQNCKQPSKRR